MSEHILTTEEIDQFISSLQSGEIVLEPIWTEAPADIVYSPIQYVFGPMKDDARRTLNKNAPHGLGTGRG